MFVNFRSSRALAWAARRDREPTYLAANNAAGRNSRQFAYLLTIPDVFPVIVKDEGASMGGKERLSAYLAAKNAAELRRARAGGSGANGGGSDACCPACCPRALIKQFCTRPCFDGRGHRALDGNRKRLLFLEPPKSTNM